jgi:hypothetical protein
LGLIEQDSAEYNVKMLGLQVYKNNGSYRTRRHSVKYNARMFSLIKQNSAEYNVQMLNLQVYKNFESYRTRQCRIQCENVRSPSI